MKLKLITVNLKHFGLHAIITSLVKTTTTSTITMDNCDWFHSYSVWGPVEVILCIFFFC